MTDSKASEQAQDWGADQVPLSKLVMAQTLMKHGFGLGECAINLGVRSRDLDLALWDSLCRYGRRP